MHYTNTSNPIDFPVNLTAEDVISIVLKRAQSMREEGESDLRSIIYLCNGLRNDMKTKSREEILSEMDEE